MAFKDFVFMDAIKTPGRLTPETSFGKIGFVFDKKWGATTAQIGQIFHCNVNDMPLIERKLQQC
jgi:hypothetical protein